MGTSAAAGTQSWRLVAARYDMLLASDDLPILWLEHMMDMITYVPVPPFDRPLSGFGTDSPPEAPSLP